MRFKKTLQISNQITILILLLFAPTPCLELCSPKFRHKNKPTTSYFLVTSHGLMQMSKYSISSKWSNHMETLFWWSNGGQNHIFLIFATHEKPYFISQIVSFYLSKLFIVGNNNTSLIACESVNNITNLSIPYPIPPVGGIPYSSAVKKSSSV